MLSWAAPWWLGGLALLPLIRWLHRGGRHRQVLRVPRLALWQGAAASSAAAGEKAPPDPAWRRRAGLAALLCLALAGPQWPPQAAPVTLWVDDSPSMRSRDAPGAATRLDDGLAQARAQLAELPQAQAALRTLSEPWRERGVSADALAVEAPAGAERHDAAPPPAALLRADREHWLVTDGADAALLAWPDGRRPDRVIRVGQATRNVGLTHLSARRKPDDPRATKLLLRLSNGGDAAEERDWVLTGDAGDRSDRGELARGTQRLAPGASVLVGAAINAPLPARVRATLQPGDALAEDDALTLDLAPLQRRRVAVDARCPPALAAAVRAHPALAAVAPDAADADARLDCGGAAAARPLPTLRAVAERLPQRATAAATWSASLTERRRVRLDDHAVLLAATLPPHAGDRVLLAFGDEAAIVLRADAPRRIDTSLDFAAMAAAGGTATPLLLNLMFEELFDAPLLDAVAQVSRRAASVRIVPAAQVPVRTDTPRPEASATPRDVTRPLLYAAWLLLAWEIAALARQARRLREPAQAGSA